MNEEQEKLLTELHDHAVELRGSWGEFDGRDELKYINGWIDNFRKASEEK